MNTLKKTLLTALKRAGYLALACGLPLTASLYAQSSSSSYDNAPTYNNQYNNGNGQYGNGPNNNRTPRYTGHSWADHLVFEGGAGGTAAADGTQDYANPGFNVLLGAGLKFNSRLSLLAEWNFNDLGVPHSVAGVIAGTPDGNEHLWTADLNPKFNLIRTRTADLYAIGGGGFSRALVNYTVPVLFNCGYYYGYYGYGYGGPCVGNVTVAHTSSNQANVDGGMGIEWRLSPYERGKLFVEARYVKLYTPSGLPPGQNAAIIPVTLGYRW